MEYIEDILHKDEKILWIYTRERNFLIGPITYVIFQIIFLIIANILLIPWILTSQGSLLLVGVILYLIFMGGIGILIPISIHGVYLMKKRLNLDYQDLRNYHEVYAMTNERWVQKNYHWNFARNSGFDAYPEDALLKDVDSVSIRLGEIDAISTRRNGKVYDTFIYTDYQRGKPFATSYLCAFLPKKYFDDFVKILVNETNINYSTDLNGSKTLFTREEGD